MKITTELNPVLVLESILNELPHESSTDIIWELNSLREALESRLDFDPDALLYMLFVDAIKEHYEPHSSILQHIYLERFEIPQIKLFDILIEKFPFVASGHSIGNKLISRWVGEHSSVVLVDVGIGRGIQIASLVRMLSENKKLRNLTIIGVEPFGDAIQHANSLLQSVARSAPFEVNIHIIEGFVENINAEKLLQLFPASYDEVIVNDSLAIHHTPSVKLRKAVFAMLRQLNPDAMLLIEPDSDHMTDDWATRTRNAWKHYGAIFDTIDQLAISKEEKNGLKVFFGREIKDVVAQPDKLRFERHEPSRRWVSYAGEIGMEVEDCASLPEMPGDVISISACKNGLTMKRKETDVLALIPLIKSHKSA